MEKYDVYLYGMVLLTNSFLLKESYPRADSYAEVREKYCLPGGETGTAGTILANFNVKVKMDGNHLGQTTYEPIRDFYADKSVDISAMTNDPNYIGLKDFVIIDKNTRTCFGEFENYFSNPQSGRWNKPQKEDIENAKVASIDPFFYEESILAAKYCHEAGKKYSTIDCKYDTMLNKYCEVNIVSNEFIQNNYKDCNIEELFNLFTSNTDGLVIFTFGPKDVMFGRKGEAIKKFTPFKVDVVSTLGAGDSFKAGVTYAILKHMCDEEIVRFACATAAVAICSFPLPLNPPTIEKVNAKQNML